MSGGNLRSFLELGLGDVKIRPYHQFCRDRASGVNGHFNASEAKTVMFSSWMAEINRSVYKLHAQSWANE
jgi:hypothetical protein